VAYHRFYDFTIDGAPSGYFEISDDGAALAMNAVFVYGGKTIENPFGVTYERGPDGLKIIGFRAGTGPYLSPEELALPKDHYPSCAYPLLLGRVKRSWEYVCVSEKDGTPEGRRVLTREGTVIRETLNGSIARQFTMEGDVPVAIHWGGPARSTLKRTRDAAVAGSPMAISVPE
jgi:hypothetical protein